MLLRSRNQDLGLKLQGLRSEGTSAATSSAQPITCLDGQPTPPANPSPLPPSPSPLVAAPTFTGMNRSRDRVALGSPAFSPWRTALRTAAAAALASGYGQPQQASGAQSLV
jgi:hypothetical protein